MPEQFALEQVGGNRAAIDRHERMSGAAGQLVDVARDHFLAGAGLAEDQHVGIERRDLLDQPVNGPHRPRVAAGAEAVGSRLRRMAVAHVLRLVQDCGQPALLDGKVEVQPGDVAARFGNLGKAVARQKNHRQGLRHGAQARDQLRALRGDGLGADDERQPIVGAFGFSSEFGQIMKTNGLQVEKSKQRLELARLRV